MDIETAVIWVEAIKNRYGRNVEAVMEEHLNTHQHSAQAVAQQTIAFGLMTDDPDYMNQFMHHGGDVAYLQYVANCFIKVRSKYFGL